MPGLPVARRAATIAVRYDGAGRMREAVDSMERKRRPARNPGIDLLRGLAIVLVVFNHLGCASRWRRVRWPECCRGGC